MSILFTNHFKKVSSPQIAKLLNYCCIVINPQDLNSYLIENKDLLAIIYIEPYFIDLILEYELELNLTAREIGIDRIEIIQIDNSILNHYFNQAQFHNTLEDWQAYLELQYLAFSEIDWLVLKDKPYFS